jgi:hypothetical protein
MLSAKARLFMPVRLLFIPECRLALWRCIKSALTSDVEFLNVRVRNGLNAHAMVLSTTELVKKRVDQPHVEWIVSELLSRTVFSLLTQAQFLQAHQLASTPLVKKLKGLTVSAEDRTNHDCIN